MSPFRRQRQPLHERLAEQGGLDLRSGEPEPLEPQPALNVPGLGVQRAQRWDAVVSVQAPGLTGDEVHFVALLDGSLVVEEDVPDDSLGPLADAVEEQLQPPYRAEGLRRGETVWAVAALRIALVELLEEPDGDEVELSVHGGERSLTVDGERAYARLPSLERLAADRGLSEYVIRAERVDGPLWEVALSPL